MLLTAFREGSGNVLLLLAGTCRSYRTRWSLHVEIL